MKKWQLSPFRFPCRAWSPSVSIWPIPSWWESLGKQTHYRTLQYNTWNGSDCRWAYGRHRIYCYFSVYEQHSDKGSAPWRWWYEISHAGIHRKQFCMALNSYIIPYIFRGYSKKRNYLNFVILDLKVTNGTHCEPSSLSSMSNVATLR